MFDRIIRVMSTSKKLSVLEERIVDAVNSGKRRFREICVAVDINPDKEEMRLVDRALQKLKRKGTLRYGRSSGWHVSR